MRTLVLIILGVFSIIGISMLMITETTFFFGCIILGLTIAYLIFSFGIVDGKKGEIGALFTFGKPIENLGPGVFFVPALIASLRIEKGTIFQSELPSDPENIYRGNGLPPGGKFFPIRVKFGPPNPLDTDLVDNPYNIEGVEEVVPVVVWRITDLVTFSLIAGDNANCRQMLSSITVQIIWRELANRTPAKASRELDIINQEMMKGLKGSTKGWGIDILQAYMKPFVFSHSLNNYVEAVSIARETAKAVRLTAQGEKDKRIAEAEGTAKAVELTAAAEKLRLIQTGLAKVDTSGNITELVPDANTKANTDAIAALAGVTGTLVLGREAVTPIINIQKREG